MKSSLLHEHSTNLPHSDHNGLGTYCLHRPSPLNIENWMRKYRQHRLKERRNTRTTSHQRLSENTRKHSDCTGTDLQMYPIVIARLDGRGHVSTPIVGTALAV